MRKTTCTKAGRFLVHFLRKWFHMIDFLHRMCHTIATGNVPDNVPDESAESEEMRHDDQGHRPHQRLFRQHHLPCDQRPARCAAGNERARSEGHAGSGVHPQHQRPAVEDSAVPELGVRGQGRTQPLLFGLPRSIAAGRYPVRIQRHRLLSGRERQRDRRSRKDPAGDQAQRHHLPRRQREQLPERFCQHYSPFCAGYAGLQ